jgi:hypothetical protein
MHTIAGITTSGSSGVWSSLFRHFLQNPFLAFTFVAM